jgi:hypothetical protein
VLTTSSSEMRVCASSSASRIPFREIFSRTSSSPAGSERGGRCQGEGNVGAGQVCVALWVSEHASLPVGQLLMPHHAQPAHHKPIVKVHKHLLLMPEDTEQSKHLYRQPTPFSFLARPMPTH